MTGRIFLQKVIDERYIIFPLDGRLDYIFHKDKEFGDDGHDFVLSEF